MEMFWEACRYRPLELIYKYADVCTLRLTQQYTTPLLIEQHGAFRDEEVEDIDFQALLVKLRQTTLERGFTLVVWCGYVKKAVYLEIRKQIVKRGLLPERNDCGHCKHFALGPETYFCVLTGEARHAHDSPCPEFSPDVVTLDPDAWKPDEIKAASNDITHSEDYTHSRIVRITKLLCQRFEQEPHGKKHREKYLRQYEVFKYFSHLLSTGVAKEEAKHLLATVHDVSKKTIERDLEEIEKYLLSINFFSPKNVASDALYNQGVSHNESSSFISAE